MNSRLAQGTVRALLIGLLVVTLAGSVFFAYYNDLGTQYGVSLENQSSFTQFQEEFSEINESARELESSLSGFTEGNAGLTDYFTSAIKGAQATAKLLGTPLRVAGDLVNSAADNLGIGFLSGYGVVVVLLLIVFAIMGAWLKWNV